MGCGKAVWSDVHVSMLVLAIAPFIAAQLNPTDLQNECVTFDDRCAVIMPTNPNITLEVTARPLNVTCKLRKYLTKKYPYLNSSLISFTLWRGNDEHSISQDDITVLSRTRARLESADVQLKDSSVRCKLRLAGGASLLTAQHMIVGRVPYRPIDVSATIYDWERMTIRWNSEGQNTAYKTNYTAWWKYDRPQLDWTQCGPVYNANECVVDSVDAFPDSRRLLVQVNNSNAVGANSSALFTASIAQLIMPARVDGVRSVDVQARSANLTWDKPSIRRFIYRVNYTCHWPLLCPKSLEVRDGQALWLQNLHPHTPYNVSLEARYAGGGEYWSSPAFTLLSTHQAVPDANPPVTASGYWSKSENKYRDVTIYWQAVPAEKRNGEITEYSVTQVTDGHTEQLIAPSVPSSAFSYTVRNLSVQHEYSFSVKASTLAGTHSGVTHFIRVPKTRHEPTLPRVTLSALDSHTVRVQWRMAEDQRRVIVYWCPGSVHQQLVCSGEMSWQEEDAHVEEADVDLGAGADYRQLMFGVSAEFSSTTAGIQWVQCVYDQHNDPARPKETSKESRQGDRVEIGLETACSGNPSMTEHYELTYCRYPAARDCTSVDMTRACQGRMESETVRVRADARYTLRGLREETTYLVKAVARSSSRASIPNQFCVTTSSLGHMASLRGNAVLITLLVLGAVCVLALAAVGVFACLRGQWRCVKKAQKWSKIPISTPEEVESNTNLQSHSRHRGQGKKTAEVLPIMQEEDSGDDGDSSDDQWKVVMKPHTVAAHRQPPRPAHPPSDTDTSALSSGDSRQSDRAHRPVGRQLIPRHARVSDDSGNTDYPQMSSEDGSGGTQPLIIRLPHDPSALMSACTPPSSALSDQHMALPQQSSPAGPIDSGLTTASSDPIESYTRVADGHQEPDYGSAVPSCDSAATEAAGGCTPGTGYAVTEERGDFSAPPTSDIEDYPQAAMDSGESITHTSHTSNADSLDPYSQVTPGRLPQEDNVDSGDSESPLDPYSQVSVNEHVGPDGPKAQAASGVNLFNPISPKADRPISYQGSNTSYESGGADTWKGTCGHNDDYVATEAVLDFDAVPGEEDDPYSHTVQQYAPAPDSAAEQSGHRAACGEDGYAATEVHHCTFNDTPASANHADTAEGEGSDEDTATDDEDGGYTRAEVLSGFDASPEEQGDERRDEAGV